MDVELLGLFTSIVVITGLAVYFLSTRREKSFEEAIAEQKQRSEELLGKKKKRKKPVEKKKTVDKKKVSLDDHVAIQTPQEKHVVEPVSLPAEKHLAESVTVPSTEKVLEEEILSSEPFNNSASLEESVEKVEQIEIVASASEAITEVDSHGNTNPEIKVEEEGTASEELVTPLQCEVLPVMTVKRPTLSHQTPSLEGGDPPHLVKQIANVQVGGKERTQRRIKPNLPESSTSGNGRNTSEQKDGSEEQKKSPQKNLPMDALKLQSLIETCNLSSEEITSLVDALLSRNEPWVKKNAQPDLTETLQTKLKDAESSNVSLQQKLKELRLEIHTERSRWALKLDEDKLKAKEVERKLGELIERERREASSNQNHLAHEKSALASENAALRAQSSHLESQLQAAFKSNQDLTQSLHKMKELVTEAKKEETERATAKWLKERGELEEHLRNEYLKREAEEREKWRGVIEKLVQDTALAEKNSKNLLEDSNAKLADLHAKASQAALQSDSAQQHLTSEVTNLLGKNVSLQNSLTLLEEAQKNKEQASSTQNEKVAQLTEELKAQKMTITSLDSSLANKEKMVSQLEQESSEQKLKITSLELSVSTLNEKDEKIAQLAEESSVQRSNIASLELSLSTLSEKDKKITQLAEESNVQRSNIASLEVSLSTLNEKDEKIAQLVEESSAQRLNIASLELSLGTANGKDEKIAQLVEELSAQRLNIASLELSLGTANEKDEKIAQLVEELSAQRLNIASLELSLGTANEKDEKIAQLAKELNEQNNKIISLESSVPEKQEQLAQLVEEISAQKVKTTSLELSMTEKDAKLIEITLKNSQLLAKLDSSEDRSNQQLKESEVEVARYKDVLKTTEELLRMLQGCVEEKEIEWTKRLEDVNKEKALDLSHLQTRCSDLEALLGKTQNGDVLSSEQAATLKEEVNGQQEAFPC